MVKNTLFVKKNQEFNQELPRYTLTEHFIRNTIVTDRVPMD